MIFRRREKPDPFPRDWPAEVRATARAHLDAHVVATKRIRARRRRLSQADAEAIVREEATRREITREDAVVEQTARLALRSRWWPLLHPRRAREAGWHLAWERDTSAEA